MLHESKLAKRERSHNYLTRLKEQVETKELEINELENENKELLAKNKSLQEKIDIRNETIDVQNQLIDEKNTVIDEKEAEVTRLNFMLKLINQDYSEIKDLVDGLKEKFTDKITAIANDLLYRSVLLRKNKPKAQKYAAKIINNYAEITEKSCRDICKSAAKTVKDNEVIDLMDENEEENSFK